MTLQTFLQHLVAIGASKEILDWVRAASVADPLQPAESIYNSCERGDWLLELAAQANVDLRTIVLACCAAARTALQYVPEGERRPLVAIETAERWAQGISGV